MRIEIIGWCLKKGFREFRIHYEKAMKALEISLYFWNIVILFGEEENGR